MSIVKQVRLALGGQLLLILFLAICAFFGVRLASSLAQLYPDNLLPAIRSYEEMRITSSQMEAYAFGSNSYDANDLAQKVRRSSEDLLETLRDGPFASDPKVKGIIDEAVALMGELGELIVAHETNAPISPQLLKALEHWHQLSPRAELTIQYVISETTKEINNVASIVKNVVLTLGSIALLISAIAALGIDRILRKGISALLTPFSQIANGDLSTRAIIKGRHEFAQMASHFNDLATGLSETIGSTGKTLVGLKELSGDFKGSSENYAKFAGDQSAETQQLAAAMTEMAATIKEIARNADETANHAIAANQKADLSRNSLKKANESATSMLTAMDELSNRVESVESKTRDISSVVKTIREITDKTNLLALNASIEAARAGEHGRGFAVVADEVRTLSIQTALSTEEIEKVVNELQAEGRQTSQTARENHSSVSQNVDVIFSIEKELSDILDAVARISDMNQSIACAAEQQAQVTEDMDRNVNRISEFANANAEETQSLLVGVKHIDEMINDLVSASSKWKFTH